MEKILKTIIDYITTNPIICGIAAGLFVLALIFIILFAVKCKKAKKYKKAYDELPNIKTRLKEVNKHIDELYQENQSLTFEKTQLKHDNSILMAYKADHEQIPVLQQEIETLKEKNSKLESKFSNKITTTTRTSELSIEELTSLPKSELEKICKKRKLTGWTALKKAELVQFIFNKIHK